MGGEDVVPGATGTPDGDRSTPPLTFPDSPRMELDQLLAQLVERAQEVMHTQGRLRGLLRANQAVMGELGLPAALRRIVEMARELVGARYAALGVVAPDGGLAQFIHSGMPEGAVERVGHLPQGKGLLGALIDDPRLIRLDHLSEDPRSSGFPSGHPPMSTFLGVPIRIRGEVYGNLYLAESTRGHFTAEDEELVSSLAATAGVVIDNARLYESARTRGEWLQALATITRHLLAVDTARPLQLIAERTRDIARADLVVVALPVDEGELSIDVVVGAGGQALSEQRVPVDGSLVGQVLLRGEALRVAAPEDAGSVVHQLAGVVDVGPVMVLPLLGAERVRGVLGVVRLRGGEEFTAADLDLASSFANQAGIALELAEARAEQQRSLLLEERERIAADLHDHVIQRLFAAGLSLNALAGTLGAGRSTDRLMEVVGVLDDTIGRIRDTIFQLHQLTRPEVSSLRSQVLAVVGELTPSLGIEAGVRFTGPLDTVVDPGLAEDLVAVLREALTNVARHARARSAEVDVTTREGRVVLDVRDDGVGMGPSTRRSGLANMRQRAQRRGGEVQVTAGEPSGTHLCWSVPLR
jgi:signal transduction histidine kinase